MAEAVDYKLLHFLKMKLNQQPYGIRELFKSQFHCQNHAARQPGMRDAVWLLRNNASEKHQAIFFGSNHCKSTFICPVCAERRMAKYRSQIQSAIEALKDKGYAATMFTFTIPHNQWFTCEDSFKILQNSMRKLQKHWGSQVSAKKFCSNAWTRLQRDLDLKHYVRCTEFTYGRNGWHPHYHCLYWTKKENLQLFKDYEKDVLALWYKIVRAETIKQFVISKPQYTEEEVTRRIDEFFTRTSLSNTDSVSFFISKDENGDVLEAQNSDYITGWGSDMEMTGLKHKTGKTDGRYTTYDLIEIAAGHKTAKISAEKAWDLFLDYAITVKRLKAKRVKMSTNRGENLKSIITQWQNVNGMKEVLKKKQQDWECLCWFTKQQWWKICWLEYTTDIPVMSNILYLSFDTRLLKEYLESLEIYAFDNEEHTHTKLVEDIMNGTAKDIVHPENSVFEEVA